MGRRVGPVAATLEHPRSVTNRVAREADSGRSHDAGGGTRRRRRRGPAPCVRRAGAGTRSRRQHPVAAGRLQRRRRPLLQGRSQPRVPPLLRAHRLSSRSPSRSARGDEAVRTRRGHRRRAGGGDRACGNGRSGALVVQDLDSVPADYTCTISPAPMASSRAGGSVDILPAELGQEPGVEAEGQAPRRRDRTRIADCGLRIAPTALGISATAASC
jgi:hypothetical protein